MIFLVNKGCQLYFPLCPGIVRWIFIWRDNVIMWCVRHCTAGVRSYLPPYLLKSGGVQTLWIAYSPVKSMVRSRADASCEPFELDKRDAKYEWNKPEREATFVFNRSLLQLRLNGGTVQ